MDTSCFQALQDEKIDFTSLPMMNIQAESVTLDPGRNNPAMRNASSDVPTEAKTVPAAVMVFANGYEIGEWPYPLGVTGPGVVHCDTWSEHGRSQAYLGTAMDGFPNFFFISTQAQHCHTAYQCHHRLGKHVQPFSKVRSAHLERRRADLRK